MRVFNLFFILLLTTTILGQNKDIYIFEDKYNISLKELNDNSNLFEFKSIEIFGQYMMDPKKVGVVHYDLVDKYLAKMFPQKDVSGILCINLEGELYDQLKNNSVESEKFIAARDEYIKLADYIKSYLPNIKIGFYGIPFNGYYDFQFDKQSEKKLDTLLKHIDVLFPSLYIAYPASQKSIKSNFDYLKRNLDVSFAYSTRLDKPVYPFFWYLVHPSNKKYGSAVLPKEELLAYLEYINNYEFNKRNVSGIVWWDSDTPFKKGIIKYSLFSKDQEMKFNTLHEAFKYYLYTDK